MSDETATEPIEINRPEWMLEEANDHYHKQAVNYLSSHQIIEFMECPWVFNQRLLGNIPRKSIKAFRFGWAAHTFILEGQDQYSKDVAIGGPINEKTGKPYGSNTKKFEEWEADQGGKPVLTFTEHDNIVAMNDSIRRHELASDLLSNGIPEGVIRLDVNDVPCQVRLDWLNFERKCIVDLKTCAELSRFMWDATSFGYFHQLAFYRSVFMRAANIPKERTPPVYIVAVEKKPPFLCGVFELGAESLAIAGSENMKAIEEIKECRESHIWPTRWEEARVLDFKGRKIGT